MNTCVCSHMKPQQLQPEEREAALLDEIKARCENWRQCYRDRPRRNISSTLVAMNALKKALYDPKKAERDNGYPPDSNPYEIVPDQRDADILQEVWNCLGHEGEADLVIGGTGMTVATAKTIIALYTFGGRVLREVARKKRYRVKRRQFGEWERVALLFFAMRVRVYETTKR